MRPKWKPSALGVKCCISHLHTSPINPFTKRPSEGPSLRLSIYSHSPTANTKTIFCLNILSLWDSCTNEIVANLSTMLTLFLPSATKLQRLCFYTCLSFRSRGRGVCLSASWDTPQDQAPPPADTPRTRSPQEQTHPREQTPQDQAPPPLETDPCTPQSRHPTLGADAPPPEQTATVADGTHPTVMHSCYFYFRGLIFLCEVTLRVWLH